MGHPGALWGRPDPNWQPPEPEPVANERIYWLRVDRDKGHKLYWVDCDALGAYRIELPPGQYLRACGSQHRWELDRLKEGNETDEAKLTEALFIVFDTDEKGRTIFDGEPGMRIEAGRRYEEDVAARITFVD
jgi:hypothetical protein